MTPQIPTLIVMCPINPHHGRTEARPEGFRGLLLACGCELLVTPDNAGWHCKPIVAPTLTGSRET